MKKSVAKIRHEKKIGKIFENDFENNEERIIDRGI